MIDLVFCFPFCAVPGSLQKKEKCYYYGYFFFLLETKKDDTFGQDDKDWDVYKEIVSCITVSH